MAPRPAPVLSLPKASIETTRQQLAAGTFTPAWHSTPWTFRDTQNTLRTIYTTRAGTGQRCFWCMRDINGEADRIRISDDTYEGTFCGHNRFACAHAWLMRELNRPTRTRDIIYINALPNLFEQHWDRFQGTGAPLASASDYRLLKTNGGPLDDKSYDLTTAQAFFHEQAETLPVSRVMAVAKDIGASTFINASSMYDAPRVSG